MRRSQYRRESSKSKWFTGRRRIIAAVATLVAFGGIVTVTQVSDASTKRSSERALAACNNIQAPKSSKLSTKTKKGTYTTDNGKVTQHADDGAGDVPTTAQMRNRCRQWVAQNAGNTADTKAGEANGNNNAGNNNAGNNGNNNNGNNNNGNNGNNDNAAPAPGAGLGVLANSCDGSKLKPHDGFQIGDACVSTEFGEVGSENNNPSLLIVESPQNVQVNQAFTFKVSTRNLIRDRFLAAGQGGYYVESSILQGGLVRGHFHSACRLLGNTNEAPDPAAVPEFFVATEDKKGGKAPDTVTIQVPGIPKAGTAQCSSWAGDGSHRIPMMQRANQTPAFDSFRLEVGGGNNDGDNNGGGNNNGDDNQAQNQNNNQGNQQQGQPDNKQRDQQNQAQDAQNAQNSKNQNQNQNKN